MTSIDQHTAENKPGLPSWSEILQTAVSQPGSILKAYSAFHGFSLGNQIAAMMQCKERGIDPGPINTYVGWQNLNRQVKKGEKALWLCMPITCKRKNDRGEDEQVLKSFIWRPRWFVLAQTEGESVPMPQMPEWDKVRALASLGVTEVEFTSTDGNVMGYAKGREVAISPLSPLPHKTLFHELAHVELGHTAESSFNDSEHTPRSLREVEAEAVALLLCETLSLPGAEYARGYIQNWLREDVIPEKSAQKIFSVADRILRAGRDATAIK
jgi:hypothetical protein